MLIHLSDLARPAEMVGDHLHEVRSPDLPLPSPEEC